MNLTRNPLTAEQTAAIARLFSAAVVRELGRKGRSPLFARLARQTGLASTKAPETMAQFLDAAFGRLAQRPLRHEYVYKAALTNKVLLGIHSLRTASLLTEFRVADRKADVVILNGTSTVYEIKSERDNLARLAQQIAAYLSVFDRVNVIAGENHMDSVAAAVPETVGLLALSKRYQVSTRREAAPNKHQTNPAVAFESLRQGEIEAVLKLHGRPIPRLPNTQMRAALRELFVALSPREAHDAWVQVLRRTRTGRHLEGLVGALPECLRAVALATRLSPREQSRLQEAMNTNMHAALEWG